MQRDVRGTPYYWSSARAGDEVMTTPARAEARRSSWWGVLLWLPVIGLALAGAWYSEAWFRKSDPAAKAADSSPALQKVGGVYAVAFALDGRTVASGHSDGKVRLWDVEAGLQRQLVHHPVGAVRSLAFSPDGKVLATAGGDPLDQVGHVRLWNPATGERLTTLWTYQWPVLTVAFSKCGRFLAAGTLTGAVKVWDTGSWYERAAFQAHTFEVTAVAFALDGTTLATASTDNTVKLWDHETGTPPVVLRGHSDSIFALAFSADGRRLLTGSGDRTIQVWDWTTEQQLATLVGHQGQVRAMALAPDEGTLISAGGYRWDPGEMKFWDLARQQPRAVPAHESMIWCLALSPDGKTLASGGGDDAVKLWDITTSQELATFTHRK